MQKQCVLLVCKTIFTIRFCTRLLQSASSLSSYGSAKILEKIGELRNKLLLFIVGTTSKPFFSLISFVRNHIPSNANPTTTVVLPLNHLHSSFLAPSWNRLFTVEVRIRMRKKRMQREKETERKRKDGSEAGCEV